MSESDEDDLEVTPFLTLVLRRLGTLCHNRQVIDHELAQAMDCSVVRARYWLKDLEELGLVERVKHPTQPTYFPTEEGWKAIQESCT